MAVVQKYISQQSIGGNAPSVQINDYVGPQLQRLGSTLEDIAVMAQDKREKKEDFKSQVSFRAFNTRMADEMDKRDIALDGDGFHDDFMTNVYEAEKTKFLDTLPKRLREKYELSLGLDGDVGTEWSTRAAKKERDQTYSWYSDQLSQSQDAIANAISVNPDAYDQLLEDGYAQIEASDLPRAQKEKFRRQTERMAQLAMLGAMIEKDPQGVLMDLGADVKNLSPTTQLDVLEQAVAAQETGGEADPDSAVSAAGAIGRLQVMPGTARDIAKWMGDEDFPSKGDPTQVAAYLSRPDVNRKYGRFYLQRLMKQYPGDVEAALIAYHSGPGNADKWLKAGRDNSVLGPVGRKYAEGVLSKIPGASQAGRSNAPNATNFADVKLTFRRSDRPVIDSVEGEAGVKPELVNRVKASFAALGVKEAKINSGHRGEKDNIARGGADHSQHVPGNAMDIDVSGMSTGERVNLIMSLSANGIGGIGVGANIIHADLGSRRVWGYAKSSGGGPVPAWAREATQKHLANNAAIPAGGVGAPPGRFGTLPYADRQAMIQRADQALTSRNAEAAKTTALQRAQVTSAVRNELAALETSGQSTKDFDETKIASVLGEDDYFKFLNDRDRAVRTYNAITDVPMMTREEMDSRLQDYEPVEGSPTFATDKQVYDRLERAIDKTIRNRASRPDEAAMEFPDVKQAYEAMQAAPESPEAVQEFVRLSLAKQEDFNLKPGSEAPVPRTWGIEIGKAFSRVPTPGKGVTIQDIRAAIAVQYQQLQKVFGPYTEEVIIYGLQQYRGMNKDSAELINSYMQQIEAGRDPLKLRDDPEDADRAGADDLAQPGMWQTFKDFWSGTRSTAPEDQPEPSAPSAELILRARDKLEGGDPEDYADAVQRYGQRAVDAAQRQLEGK